MIQKTIQSDLEQIVLLEERNLKSSLGYNFLKEELLHNEFSFMLTLKINDQIVGYLSSRIFDDTAELLNIVIDKSYQNQRNGSKLLEFLISELKRRKIKTLILEVRPSNLNAQYLYYKYNFKRILNRPNYYQDEDAYVFLWENDEL